jgi:hypothetical protein
LYTYHNEIINGEYKLNLPHIVVSSAHFHPSSIKIFPSWESTKNLFVHSKDKRYENIVVKNTGHLHQCDLASLIPLELFLTAKYRP